jgi:hypothetical protein
MDGPDLSHLLDSDDSSRPTAAVLDAIVRRHRRLRARRAQTAATVGLVVVVAGAGVGIGLSRRGTTTSALRNGAHAPSVPSATKPGPPESSGPLSTALGTVPAGLGWVDAGSGTYFGISYATPTVSSPLGVGQLAASARLRVTGTSSADASTNVALCGPLSCPDLALGTLRVGHLFTRTSDGVTVRAFSAVWAEALVALVPESSSGGSASGHSSAGSGKSQTSGRGSPGASPSCALTRALIVEVSDAGAVGTVTVPLGLAVTKPLDVLADEVVGVAERSPIAVVVAHVTGATTAVEAEFSAGGRDEMSVVDRWAVLVHKLTAARAGRAPEGTQSGLGQATVDALTSDGHVLEQALLPGSGALALAVGTCGGSGGNHKSPGANASSSGGPAPAPSTTDPNNG